MPFPIPKIIIREICWNCKFLYRIFKNYDYRKRGFKNGWPTTVRLEAEKIISSHRLIFLIFSLTLNFLKPFSGCSVRVRLTDRERLHFEAPGRELRSVLRESSRGRDALKIPNYFQKGHRKRPLYCSSNFTVWRLWAAVVSRPFRGGPACFMQAVSTVVASFFTHSTRLDWREARVSPDIWHAAGVVNTAVLDSLPSAFGFYIRVIRCRINLNLWLVFLE